MRTIYREAEQGHPVARRAYEAQGPFARQEPVVVPLDYDPDRQFPPGATAQNGMAGPGPYYECSDCGAVLTEKQTRSHACEGDD